MSGIFRNVRSEEKKMEPWKEIADSIIETVKGKSEEFLRQNAAAKDFIEDRGRRLAKLVYQYKTAGDDAAKQEAHRSLNIVRQTIENELSALALAGQEEAKRTFKEIVSTAFGVVVKAAPAILSAI